MRNRLDGSVELLAHGEDEAVEALVEACRTGPPSAKVERIEVESVEGDPATLGFDVAATG